MNIREDWEWVLKRAWSVKLIVLAAVLSGIEVMLAVLSAYQVALPIAPGTFAALSGFVTIAAFVARFIAQDHDT